MNKREFIKKFSDETGFTQKDSAIAVDAFMACLSDTLAQGENVTFVGFGTFRNVRRKERHIKNVDTKKRTTIPAHNAVVFKAGSILRDRVK